MMGELRVEGTVLYCVESCEVPKQSSAAQRPPGVCVCVCRRAHGAQQSSSSSKQLCGARSWPACALPGQEGQGPGPETRLALSMPSVPMSRGSAISR